MGSNRKNIGERSGQSDGPRLLLGSILFSARANVFSFFPNAEPGTRLVVNLNLTFPVCDSTILNVYSNKTALSSASLACLEMSFLVKGAGAVIFRYLGIFIYLPHNYIT